jgi:hypothetical protein
VFPDGSAGRFQIGTGCGPARARSHLEREARPVAAVAGPEPRKRTRQVMLDSDHNLIRNVPLVHGRHERMRVLVRHRPTY